MEPPDRNKSGVPIFGGEYIRYELFGTLFDVTAKYVPPIRLLGRGGAGIVFSAVNSKTGEEVAIKKIGSAFSSSTDAKRVLREIKLLLHMKHENVISIRDIIRPPRIDDFNDLYVVYERMDTDLNKLIRSKQLLTEDHRRYFLYQLLRGLKYVHSANVLHRDLKPSNLLVNTNCDLKIGDFGLARVFSETEFMTEYVVTRWYRAPELLFFCNEYNAAIDVWSVGCIFMELLTGETLFPGRDHVHQLRLITELIGSPEPSDLGFLTSENSRRYASQLQQFPKQAIGSLPKFSGINSDALDLIERMLVFDPWRRITVEEALCHPYLETFHDVNDEPACRAPPFEFDFDRASSTLSIQDIKALILMDAFAFNPLSNNS